MTRGGFGETIVGLGVIAAAAAFLVYAFGASGRALGRGYEIEAVFGDVGGVTPGAEVRISGVKVGAVAATGLEPITYEARLRLAIDAGVEVPDDSVAKIASDGLIGSAHVAIEPGASESLLASGGRITRTQGAVDFLSLAVDAFTSRPPAGAAEDERP
ncbi:MAG: outer membrane lipid asymmetry maintenance protein MlaD [Parvularculaceae bacterium]